jgi:tetratricopeptide (TPR) repeat protein
MNVITVSSDFKKKEKGGAMKQMYSCILKFFISVSIAIVLYPAAASAKTCEQWDAKVVSVQGDVQSQRVGETQWKPVTLNDTYCSGDKIRVQKNSRADIALANHPVLRLDQNSTITLGGIKDEKTSVIDLVKGAAHFFSRVTRNLEVRTATVNAGVEGTEFFVRVDEDKTFLSIFEGLVLASNQAGSLEVATGQSAVAEAGKAPSYITIVNPRDAVQWALYYPPIVFEHPEDLKDSDPRFYTYRASSLLQVGRVEEAKADISRALELDSGNSMAFALQSIIAVVQNEKENALALAEKGVNADPDSATAQIALSYALQANFNLDGALNSLQKAVTLEPDNALAWARLSEMWQSFGKHGKSLTAAEKAVALNPDISRTQTVLGFAYLSQVKTGASKIAFEKAIVLDQADPLPRLGLGLTKIREGEVQEGRREIEIAVSLDPDSSIIRSYLGKSYFEEKRPELDGPQYDFAKELDPKDPTPWFYDALRKQTENRPVEALHDMGKAIELNDNRAVYRSKLLLDEDLAARSASLARIYSDLGFEELALVEGWKSLNADPSNFSAHRFLADSYSVRPRHEIARVSELLQSQLLQPLNSTPIQPRLAESNLLLISSGGSAGLSFNEFNPLFNRDRFTLQASGFAGENGTFGEEVVVSGISNKFSFSIGQTHFETDGWRENADQNDNIYNAFVQVQVSPSTSFQAEFRNRDIELGDLALRFFEDEFLPGERSEEDTYSFRFGLHHEISPGSDLIASFMVQDSESGLNDTTYAPFEIFDLQTEQDAYSGELQYLYRSKNIKTIAGVGYFNINAEDELDLMLLIPIDPFLPPMPIEIKDVFDFDTDHTNVYLYSHIDMLKNVTFTLGGSYDHIDASSEDVDGDQFNPKFGFTFTPLENTTIRGAAFRTLKRTLITNQTLEPTQVAGFNQFYDDINGTEAWRYGIAVDQKFTRDIYAGAEYSMRDLEVPFIEFTGDVTEVDWEEKLTRAYVYWTPHNWLSLSAEYSYEKIEREELTLNAGNVKTHRIPLGLNFHHSSGFSTRLKATFFDQEGDFEPLAAPPGVFESGEDDFWLFDASISYRLPKRHGIITVGATNLFDESFNYFDTDPVNPSIIPDRMFFARLTLAF